MPLMVTTLCVGICSSTKAFCSAASTPKSPQPGHQSGSTFPFSSAIVRLARCTLVAICVSSSDHNLVHGNRKFRVPGELFLHGVDNVVRHKGFAVVLANVPAGHKAGFAAQVARKLPAVVVLHDDGVPRTSQDFENGFAMQRHQPADLKLIGRDSLFVEEFTSFLDYSFGRTPANQGDVGVTRT